MYDITIIGGGPGGVAAGVYAARKQLKALFLTDSFGGQSGVSSSIENWIGTITVSGFEYGQMLEKHLRAQESIEIKAPEKATKIEGIAGGYAIATDRGNRYETKAVILATGGHHKKLGAPGEEKLNGKGVAYCSTCDGPFFKNKRVAVVGGGNSALEAVEDLIPYASSVELFVRSNVLRGDPVTQERIKSHPKVTITFNTTVEEILGDVKVTGVRIKNKETGETAVRELEGVFVEVGIDPNTEFLRGFVDLDERNEIIIDHRTAATSRPGIFAVGDATNAPYKQNNISAGYGVTAALAAYDYLKTR